MSVRRSYGHPGTGQGLFVSVCHCDYCDQQYRAAASDALVTRNPLPYEPTGHSRLKHSHLLLLCMTESHTSSVLP